MGFGRRFKGLGKLVKKGVKFAAEAGLISATGGTGIGAIAASKLKSRGEKKRALGDAQKLKRDGLRLQITKGQPTRPPSWAGNTKVIPKGAQKTIVVRGEGAALLASSAGAKREAFRKKSLESLESTKALELKISKLSPGQKEDLADEFKRQGGGSPAAFKQFLKARL